MLATKAFGDLVTFTRASAKWVPNAAGVLTQVAAGVAAVAYDPLTLEKLGVSIEEARTNLLTYSQDFSNAAWTKSQCTLTAGSVLAPDGTQAYRLIEASGASSSKELARPISSPFTAGVSYSLSIYARVSDAGSARALRLAFTSATITAGSVSAAFDLSAGVVLFATNCTALITGVGNGWFRCSIVVAATVTSTSSIYMTAADAGGSASYTGDGVSGLYFWGAQLEAGAFRTSYIPTASAQVTRAADSAVIGNVAPWLNPTDGTLFVEGIFDPAASGASPTALASLEADVSNRIQLRKNAASGQVNVRYASNGGDSVDASAGPTVLGGVNRVAISYGQGRIDAYANGSAIVGQAISVVPLVNKLVIGFGVASGQGCWVRTLRYFPKRLSNADLQTLTTKVDPGFTLDFDFGAKTYYMGLA